MRPTLFLIAAALPLTACGSDAASKPAERGPAETRSFAAADFTAVEAAGPDTVTIVRGPAFSVSASGPRATLDLLDVRVEGNRLVIGRKPRVGIMVGQREPATIAVTLPALTAASLSGSGAMSVDRLAADAVSASLSGSGDLRIAAIEAKSAELALSGSGDITVDGGRSDRLDVSIAGSGDIAAPALRAASADVSIAGSGSLAATVAGPADVAIAGSGDVRLTGGAQCTTSKAGSGSVDCQ